MVEDPDGIWWWGGSLAAECAKVVLVVIQVAPRLSVTLSVKVYNVNQKKKKTKD